MVRSAFTAVTKARETMNTKINEANKYENKRMNKAEGEKAAILSLDSYKKTIGEQTVIVFPSDSPYAKLLMGYTE